MGVLSQRLRQQKLPLTRISHLEESSLDPPTSLNPMNKGCYRGDGTKQRGIQWVKRNRPRYASILTEV